MYNNVYFKGLKSDIENDGDDGYVLIRKKFRVKLNFVGVGDYLVDGFCFCCFIVILVVVKVFVKFVCVGIDMDLD